MRTAEEGPLTLPEVEIESLLILDGWKETDIQFRGGPNHSHGGRRYLRVDYWKQIKPETLKAIELYVTEEVDDGDEDCLPKYMYPFKKNRFI